MEKQIKISFIVTARNDDYGGNLINRMSVFLKTLIHLTNKYELDSELVFVEYNPPPEKPTLKNVLDIKNNNNLAVRFITVPKSFHDQFPTASKIPVMEYIAKNIGARRAKGEYLLCMNPDIILSEDMVNFLKNGNLENSYFYRSDRCDVSLNNFDLNMSFDEIIKKCKENTTQVWTNSGIKFVSFYNWLGRFARKPNLRNLILSPVFNSFRSSNNSIHEAAAGDFLLTHKKNWDTVGGYDEQPLSSFLDGYILYMFHCHNIEQKILPYPIYHIHHSMGKSGRPEVELLKYKEDKINMLKTKTPYKTMDPSWGYPLINFEEISV